MSGIPQELVIASNQIQLQQCQLYLSHRVAMIQSHHVIPESWWIHAGLAVASPLRDLCPNCHYGTHVAIDGILRGLNISVLPLRCRALAQEGIDGAKAAGLTPALTL